MKKFALLYKPLFCISSRMKGYAVVREHRMMQVPGAVLAHFKARLAAKDISDNLPVPFNKRLRFYREYCKAKYLSDTSQPPLQPRFHRGEGGGP